MSEAHSNASIGKLRRETGWHPLGRQGDQRVPNSSRGQHLEVLRVGQADHRWIMHARLGGRQEGPFEVNAENAWIDRGGAAHGIERSASWPEYR